MDEAGPLESKQRLVDEKDRLIAMRFVAALAALRKTFGLHVQQIADTYGLKVNRDLETIIPSNMNS